MQPENVLGPVISALHGLFMFGAGEGEYEPVAPPPPQPRGSLPSLAARQAQALLAGPRGSRAYKSRMRTLQRRITTAGQRRQTRPKMRFVIPGFGASAAVVTEGASMYLRGEYLVSRFRRQGRMPAVGWQFIPGELLAGVAAKYSAGRHMAGAQELVQRFFFEYWKGEPDPVQFIDIWECGLTEGGGKPLF